MRENILYMIIGSFVITMTSCTFAPKFNGPKFDRATKTLKVDPDKEVVLALTNAKLTRGKRGGFDSRSKQIFENLKNHEGYIGGMVKVEIFGDEVWTMTVWETEDDLKKFVNSSQHMDAMYMTNQAMKQFRHLNVKVLAKELPYSWEKAQELLNSKKLKDHLPF